MMEYILAKLSVPLILDAMFDRTESFTRMDIMVDPETGVRVVSPTQGE